jgi:hypothetical protein
MRTAKPPLWTCPKCGHRFVTRNMWHSCRRTPLSAVLRGVPADHVAVFRRFRDLLRQHGPLITVARRPRTIVFQVRVRFAGIHFRKAWVDANLWLERRASHPRLARVTDFREIGSHGYAHYFRFTAAAQLDRAFARLAGEAYQVGAQSGRAGRGG